MWQYPDKLFKFSTASFYKKMMLGGEDAKVRLTRNDKYVLRYLIDHGKVSDSEIAKKLHVSPQAVLKIRNKLDKLGIIEGFKPRINYKKLGINVMALAAIRILPAAWQEYTRAQINKKFSENAYIIWACRLPESDATHLLLYGFRDIKQMDDHFLRVQTKLARIVEIKHMHSFSVEQIIKDSPESLFRLTLENKDFYTDSLFKGSKLLNK